MEHCGARMKMVTVGQAVIVGEQVFSADRFRCRECGEFEFGGLSRESIRPLAAWGADWIMQPVPLEETQAEALAAMTVLEAARAAAGF